MGLQNSACKHCTADCPREKCTSMCLGDRTTKAVVQSLRAVQEEEEEPGYINRIYEPERYDVPGAVAGAHGFAHFGAAFFGGPVRGIGGDDIGQAGDGEVPGDGGVCPGGGAGLSDGGCLDGACGGRPACAKSCQILVRDRAELQTCGVLQEDQVVPASDEPVSHEQVTVAVELPNVGPRSSIRTLEEESRYNPSKRAKIQRLAGVYDRWRPIRGDGNCYYRTVAFGALETFLATGDVGRLERLLYALEYVQYEERAARDAHMLLLRKLRSWNTVAQLEQGIANDDVVDTALIRACRRLVRDFLVEHADQYAPNGLTYEELICALDSSFAGVEDFCSRVVDPMGRDAETLALDALPVQLGLGVRLWILDRRDGVDLVNVDFPGPAGNVDVHVLFKPGHYDLLYPRFAFGSPAFDADVDHVVVDVSRGEVA